MIEVPHLPARQYIIHHPLQKAALLQTNHAKKKKIIIIIIVVREALSLVPSCAEGSSPEVF